MSPADRRFWQLAQRRVAGLQPDVSQALLRAFAILRESLSEAELVRLIAANQLDRLLAEALSDDVMARAFIPFRTRVRTTVERGFNYTIPDTPKGGKVDGVIAMSFDQLNPRVIDAVRELDTRVMTTLRDETRDVVRAFVENGLRDGVNPRTVARELRQVIGLAPNQLTAVDNFRRSLEGDAGAGSPLTRALRDKRFDRAIAKGELSAEQIEKMTEAYRRRMLAFNAETNARTAALDSYKLGQKLAWEDAQAKGVVPEGLRLMKTWVTVGDDRVRPEHVAMNGETVPFDSRYSNGEDVPGESTFNCRCVSRVQLVRAASIAA